MAAADVPRAPWVGSVTVWLVSVAGLTALSLTVALVWLVLARPMAVVQVLRPLLGGR